MNPIRKRKLGISLLLSALAALTYSPANAQSLVSESIVGGNNIGTQMGFFDFAYVGDNSVATATATKSFTGMDGAGNTQTMTFSGTTVSQSNYGQLHVLTTGSLTNSYYNPANPDYFAANGDVANPAGSPSTLNSLGFAIFNDTLQYGGTLQAGYQARYIFHIDGTNSGTGAAADLAVNIGSGGTFNDFDAFFDFQNGFLDTTWGTKGFDVNGITPQDINIQFSDQVVFDLYNLTDGQDYQGKSDFSATVTLTGIEMVDKNGTPVSGWTVSSASGTQYAQILPSAVPEPGSIALLAGIGAPGALLWSRRRKR